MPQPHLPNPELPRHVAIIMDGNGRWAQARGKPRTFGHARGGERVRPIVERCARLGLDALTLYSFSTENWTRSNAEVDFLMDLYVEHLVSQRPLFMEHHIRLLPIGRREGLPAKVLDEMDRTVELTREHTGMTLALAVNYGSRQEITDAVRTLAERVGRGELDPAAITPEHIDQSLYTAGLPDPDLLIRTAGEMRISNFLLWQISYAELYVTDVCWPEFDEAELDAAFADFASRTRKFGAVVEPRKTHAVASDLTSS